MSSLGWSIGYWVGSRWRIAEFIGKENVSPVLLGLYLRAQNKAEPRPQVCDAGNQDNGVPVPARTQE